SSITFKLTILSDHLSIHLAIHLAIHLTIHLTIHLVIHMTARSRSNSIPTVISLVRISLDPFIVLLPGRVISILKIANGLVISPASLSLESRTTSRIRRAQSLIIWTTPLLPETIPGSYVLKGIEKSLGHLN